VGPFGLGRAPFAAMFAPANGTDKGQCAESTFRQLGQDRPGHHARGGPGAL